MVKNQKEISKIKIITKQEKEKRLTRDSLDQPSSKEEIDFLVKAAKAVYK